MPFILSEIEDNKEEERVKMTSPLPTGSGSAAEVEKEPLTKDNIVDVQRFHTTSRPEKIAVEQSLDTFLKIYKENIEKFTDTRCNPKSNKSTANFVHALIFLRHFKSHYREKYTKNPEDKRTVRREVLGLMASILQVVMNAKQVSGHHQVFLREIFLGKKARGYLKEEELEILKSDFQYSFPKLFTELWKTIGDGWYTAESSKETAVFRSSDVDPKVLQFVTKGLVDLYEEDIADDYDSAQYDTAVRALKPEEIPVSGGRSKKRKLDP